jgi:hypothetical protein
MNLFKNIFGDKRSREKFRAENIKDEKQRKLKLLEIEKKYNEITEDEYNKSVATVNKEPYVRVLNLEMDEKSPGSGYFELDFNEEFVEYLANNGYEGVEPEQIVDNWFNDLCQNIVMEGLEDEDGITRSVDSNSKEGLIIQRLKTDEDTAEYS